jgi:hypothetical protein
MTITPGERRELRSVARRTFQLLQSDLKARAEDLIEMGGRAIAEHFAEEDKVREDFNMKADKIRASAQVKIDQLVLTHPAIPDDVCTKIRVDVQKLYDHRQYQRRDRLIKFSHRVRADLANAQRLAAQTELRLLQDLSAEDPDVADIRMRVSTPPTATRMLPDSLVESFKKSLGGNA